MRHVWSVAAQVRAAVRERKLVVVKSTVPVGTNRELTSRLNEGGAIAHWTASNPEFLKEGHAIEDFMKPDRVVVGTRTAEAGEVLRQLYAPFLRNGKPFLVMSPESAEMTKYVANALLATKISFINEAANLCENVGADVNEVRTGIGYDQRIGFQFLHPGPGYGGSCFPKDTRALLATAKRYGGRLRLVEAVDEANEAQKDRLFHKLSELVSPLGSKSVAVWGLAFKPGTDDIREAPALTLIRQLLDAGAKIRAFDPKAADHVRQVFGDQIDYAADAYDALTGCDALVVVTEWQEFRKPDFAAIRARLKRPVIVDGRNLYEPTAMAQLGFTYSSIGRPTVGAHPAARARAA
jgi:UDPglucose 6-dehydrogenase